MANSTGKAGTKGAAGGSRKGKAAAGPAVTEEQRQRMIAEAAYLRAAQRGFAGGDPAADWAAAEAEINTKLLPKGSQQHLPSPKQQKTELAAYERLREEAQKRLADIKDTVSADAIRDSIDKASQRLKDVGEYTAETINKVAESLKKDIAGAARNMGPKWEQFSDKTSDLFVVWRDRGSTFLGRAASAVGDWLEQAGGRLRDETYDTGDMASKGTFSCVACDERITLQTAGHLPTCPNCNQTKFRRVPD